MPQFFLLILSDHVSPALRTATSQQLVDGGQTNLHRQASQMSYLYLQQLPDNRVDNSNTFDEQQQQLHAQLRTLLAWFDFMIG
jgi:hypothetical protein